MTHPNKPILALDPGFRDLGFAVLAGPRLVTSGVSPLRLLPRQKRLAESRRLLRQWLKAYRPGMVVLEQTHRHPTSTFNLVDVLAQSVRRAARRRGLRVTSYAPQTVRKSLVGNGKATKREVAIALAAQFPALRVYVTQDRRWKERYWQNMFDAIALAVHHQGHPPSRSRSCG